MKKIKAMEAYLLANAVIAVVSALVAATTMFVAFGAAEPKRGIFYICSFASLSIIANNSTMYKRWQCYFKAKNLVKCSFSEWKNMIVCIFGTVIVSWGTVLIGSCMMWIVEHVHIYVA